MSRRQIVPVCEFINLLRRKITKQFDCELAEQSVAQTVESLEVLKKEDQSLKMRGVEFAIYAVKQMGHGVRD